MEDKELIYKLNNISITTLKDKVEIIEELLKEKEVDFIFIEQMNTALNKVILGWWKSPTIKK